MSRGLAALALLAGLAYSFTQRPPHPDLAAAAMIAAALVLELAALRTSAGWISAGAACTLALAAWQGPALAIVTCLATLSARALFLRDPRRMQHRFDQVLSDALPVTAAALMPNPLAAFAVYATVQTQVVPFLERTPQYRPTRLALLGVAACGLAAGAMGPSLNAGWPLVAALVLVFQAEQATHVKVVREEDPQLRSDLDATLDEAARVTDQLARRLEEIQILHDLAAGLGRRPGLHETLDLVRAMVDRVTEATSIAIFLKEQDALVPASYQGPASKALEDAGLLQLQEPIVEAASAQNRTLVTRTQSNDQPRLFMGEQSAIAIPLHGQGVLYVGDPRPGGFPPERLPLLGLVSELGSVALQAALSQQEEQEALQRHARLNARLQRWAEQVGKLLEGSRILAARLDPAALSEAVEALLQELIPHDACLVLERTTGEEPLLRAVAETRAPLLIDDLQASRFGTLRQTAQSLVAVPLGEQALVLASDQPRAYTRMDQDLLALLAYQCAALLENVRLHQEVLQAYRDLQASEQHLIHSGKMAAVGQLAAGVAHEINTPLGVMRLGVQSALKALAKNPDKVPGKLENVLTALERAEAIVAKLLYYSRDARRDDQEFDLNDVVRDTIEFLAFHLRESNVRVEATLGPPQRVRGNQNELQQVLVNLLMNARDALVEAGIEDRWIGVATKSPGILEVTDRGPGMTDEVKARIFEPFYTTREVGKGTGLGLSISLQIVEKHGGTMAVCSAPGEGTVFTVQIGSEARL